MSDSLALMVAASPELEKHGANRSFCYSGIKRTAGSRLLR